MNDDDMPPPLEDMSDQISAIKQIKDKSTGSLYKNANDEEEVRLAPKKVV